MFITNNIISGCYSETPAFTFSFGGVAKQSLAKLWNYLTEYPTTESTFLVEEALFEFFLPKDIVWMNVMISWISGYALYY